MQADDRIGSSPRDQVKPATVSTDATEQDTLFGISQGSLERGTCRAWSLAATVNKGSARVLSDGHHDTVFRTDTSPAAEELTGLHFLLPRLCLPCTLG